MAESRSKDPYLAACITNTFDIDLTLKLIHRVHNTIFQVHCTTQISYWTMFGRKFSSHTYYQLLDLTGHFPGLSLCSWLTCQYKSASHTYLLEYLHQNNISPKVFRNYFPLVGQWPTSIISPRWISAIMPSQDTSDPSPPVPLLVLLPEAFSMSKLNTNILIGQYNLF